MAKRRGNNEGSISPRSNGTWRAQVTIQGQRLSFTAKTRRECQEWIKQTQKLVDNGITFAGCRQCLADHLTGWLSNEEPAMRRKTMMHYSQLIRDYVVPYIGQITLGNLRTWHLQELYTHLTSQGVGIPTIRKVHKLLHSSLELAVETGTIGRNPASYAHPPKEPFSEMKILDEIQVNRFLVSIIGHKWEALFHLAITTGMRRGELLGLKWDDMDWDKRTITVQRQLALPDEAGAEFISLKTKSGKRSVLLGEKSILVLRDHYERQQLRRQAARNEWVDHCLIFTNSKGWPICPGHLIRVFQELLNAAGLPKIRFHDLRHTAASLMLNNSISPIVVSQRLGHSKASTTLDLYGHLLPSMQAEAAELIDDLVTPITLRSIAPELHPDQ
jgi:integrase